MKILLVRHGESQDDLINAYGGWADFPLTEDGEKQIQKTAKKIKDLEVTFEKVYASPLQRAFETGRIIANSLNISIEEFIYVKERNTYGLLCGINKEVAEENYPEMVEAIKNGDYVLGQERKKDINERAQVAWEKLTNLPEENIIIITHGNFLKALIPIILDKEIIQKDDGGFILLNINKEKVTVELENGIRVG